MIATWMPGSGNNITRYDIFLVALNPTVGPEIQKTRRCIIISPNEILKLNTVLIAPMTTKGFDLPFRPPIRFKEKSGLVILDQIRVVDKTRLVKRLGHIDIEAEKEISRLVVEMFKY